METVLKNGFCELPLEETNGLMDIEGGSRIISIIIPWSIITLLKWKK